MKVMLTDRKVRRRFGSPVVIAGVTTNAFPIPNATWGTPFLSDETEHRVLAGVQPHRRHRPVAWGIAFGPSRKATQCGGCKGSFFIAASNSAAVLSGGWYRVVSETRMIPGWKA
jgi:hypothetical protein